MQTEKQLRLLFYFQINQLEETGYIDVISITNT